ncbi:MAG TPA: methyltransferase domain-containing protein [Rubrobacteraceae bacterium]|nr:methyltransferase domain-containing protein [Rubrobacteraceae bacterium]
MSLEWDAVGYEAVSEPQTGWGANLLRLYLERRALRGDEAVIDAGCGTGRVTELLLERLPRGTVLAVDASLAMVEAARGRFAGDGRVRVERWDLLELEVEELVDMIFSTATFHWIEDHPRLFGRLARALRPGGRLVAQCGGRGNIERTRAAIEEVMAEGRFKEYFAGWEDPWNFPDPETTRARLEAAGFEEAETWMHREDATFDTEEELAQFVKTAVLGRHLSVLPEGEKEPFVAAVVERISGMGSRVVDYVRLNMLAVRGSA